MPFMGHSVSSPSSTRPTFLHDELLVELHAQAKECILLAKAWGLSTLHACQGKPTRWGRLERAGGIQQEVEAPLATAPKQFWYVSSSSYKPHGAQLGLIPCVGHRCREQSRSLNLCAMGAIGLNCSKDDAAADSLVDGDRSRFIDYRELRKKVRRGASDDDGVDRQQPWQHRLYCK